MKVAAKHLLGFTLLAALQITMLCLSLHLAWRPLTSNSLTPKAQFTHGSSNTFLSLQCGDANDDAGPNLLWTWFKPVAVSAPVWFKPQFRGKPQTIATNWNSTPTIVHRRSAPRAADDDALTAHL